MPVAVVASYKTFLADATSVSPYSILTINGIPLRFDPATSQGALFLAIAKALGL